MRVKIRKGLDIPIAGRPEQVIESGTPVSTVAVLGSDVHGLRPRMAVKVGDPVRLGQTLFTDKRNPGVCFTAPGAGEVISINRGARRSLQSVVIRLDGDESESFHSVPADAIDGLDADSVRQTLAASGLWTAFRTRPYSHIPTLEAVPRAIFVTAIDTNPLAADPAVVIERSGQSFLSGLRLLTRLTEGPIYVCTAPGSTIPCPDDERFRPAEFAGPHPAGLAGTHIHFLHPVSPERAVWHVGYQDVVAFGELFATGRLPVERVVSLGGPKATRPRLVRTRLGASISDLVENETGPGQLRVISGSVLSGHRASGPFAWLGRYHNQIGIVGEHSGREFLAWARPGTDRYSVSRVFLSSLLNRGRYAMTTRLHGSPRALFPTGVYERMMPLDVLATPLLKALVVRDTERAVQLGCLELDEEDLALCTYVCPSKYEFGASLRLNLNDIELNG